MKAPRILIPAALALSVLLPALVTTTPAQGAPAPASVIAERQKIMKNNAANVKELLRKEKAGKVKEIAVNARRIANNLNRVGTLFPAGSTSDKSRAKPEIWQEKAKFERDRKAAIATAQELEDVAASGNAAAVASQVKKLGDACGTCHKSFRKPKKKK